MRFVAPVLEEGQQVGRRHRAAEEVALGFVAFEVQQGAVVEFRFDAFGDDLQLQRLAELDDGAHDFNAFGAGADGAHEGLVDLQFFDLELLQVAEGLLDNSLGMYELLHSQTESSLDAYNKLMENGVAPEMARMVLPQNTMTNWVWTGSLVAFARVYKLRIDSHAQKEAQIIAEMIDEVVSPLYPVSWKALLNN